MNARLVVLIGEKLRWQSAWAELSILQAIVQRAQAGAVRIGDRRLAEEDAVLREVDDMGTEREKGADDVVGRVGLGGGIDRVWRKCLRELGETSNARHCGDLE